MDFYYIFSKNNSADWIKLSGSGDDPIKCINVKFSCNKGNKEIGIVNNLKSDYNPLYKSVMDYKNNTSNLLIQVNRFGSLIRYGYRHNKNNFPEIKKIIPISKGEKVIQVKASAKRKAHKRVIHVTHDLDRIGDKTKSVKGITTIDYKESVKNMNDYISKLNQTDEGKEILKSMSDYTFLDYGAINNYMKDSTIFSDLPKDIIDNLKYNIRNIKKFIKDAPKFKGEVYRGLQYHTNDPESKNQWESFIKNVEGSKEIKFGSFLSTSQSKLVAVDFATKSERKDEFRSCLIKIEINAGVPIESISQVESEHEVLLDSNKIYKIISFENQDNKNYFLTLKEVQK